MGKAKTERALKDNQAMAMARLLRTSPQKLNLVAAMIRGMKARMRSISSPSRAAALRAMSARC
jgi:ribosomal protein L22